MFACGHMMPAQIDTIFLLARPYILCLHAIDVYLPARTDRTMLPVPGVHVAVTRRRVLWPAHVRKISAVLSCLTLPLVRLGFRGSIFAHMLVCINSAGISAKISHNFAMIVTFFYNSDRAPPAGATARQGACFVAIFSDSSVSFFYAGTQAFISFSRVHVPGLMAVSLYTNTGSPFSFLACTYLPSASFRHLPSAPFS